MSGEGIAREGSLPEATGAGSRSRGGASRGAARRGGSKSKSKSRSRLSAGRGGHQSLREVAAAADQESGGHGIRTHNPLRGTTFPVWPLTIRLPSLSYFFRCTYSHLSTASKLFDLTPI